MIADAFHDGRRARISNAESLAGSTSREHSTTHCAIQHRITDDGVLVRCEAGHVGWHQHDLAAAHALAEVVVGFALECERHPVGGEGAERLTRAADEANLEERQRADARVGGLTRLEPAGTDFAGYAGAHRSIAVANHAGSLEA